MSKVLVFVHGAGKQPSNYALEPLAAISLLLGYEPLCVPVFYSDITNIGSPVRMAAEPDPDAVSEFKMAFSMEVQKNVAASPSTDRRILAESISAPFLVELIATEINEIVGYLFNRKIYDQIQARMCEGLAQAALQGDQIVIASHSLGTLVAFDALRAVADRYQTPTFFTLGSSLAILRRLGNRSANLGQITRQHVTQWLNFYDTTDPISSALGPSFPQPGYRLRDVFVNIAPLPPASHDYFRNDEVLAAIADELR